MFESSNRVARKVDPMEAEKVYYRKLADGTWGLRGPSARVICGKILQVHKRDGNTRDEVVGAIVSTTGGFSVARILKPVDSSKRLGFGRQPLPRVVFERGRDY